MKGHITLIALAAIAAGGCVNKQTVSEPVKPPVAEETKKEPFTEQPAAAQPAPQETAAAMPAPDPVGDKAPATPAWGWRVQIFVSSTVENARKVAEEARWKFGDQQIFIVAADPFYKVQAGANLSRQDAELLKVRARQLGYQQAYPVEVDLGR
jgi:cell division septation protein DedD